MLTRPKPWIGFSGPASLLSRFTRRLSLGACLCAACVLILVVLLVGVQLAQRNTSQTAALAASIESRYEPALRRARDLADAVATYNRQVSGLARARSPEDLTVIHTSGIALREALSRYLQFDSNLAGSGAGELSAPVESFIGQGLAIGELYRSRAAEVRAAVFALDALVARSERVASGVGSQQPAFAELSRAVAALQASMSALFAAPSAAYARASARDASTLRSLLKSQTAALAGTAGRAWVDLELEDLTVAARGQEQFLDIGQRIDGARGDFDKAAQDLGTLIDARLQRPAWQALTQEANFARVAAAQAEQEITRMALSVITVVLLAAALLALGILEPVKRILQGTRHIASGQLDAQVPRGGVRELDELASAFNDMAKALKATRQDLREQQEALEERVATRTQQLRHLAHHDPLTGLANRRELEAHLKSAIELARAGTSSSAVFFLDVDNFKTINDSLGHQFGDRVLQEIGLRLVEVAGLNAFVARLGGDEFTIVVQGIVSDDEATEYVIGLLREFQKPVRVEGRELMISLSVGIALCPHHGQSTETLLRAADSALFSAKDRGRNGYSLFRPELLAAASHRFRTEQGLRRSLETGDLLLHFQPEVSLLDMNTSVVEALLRWRQPDGRIAAAGEFMAIAEQSGIILELSDWVLRGAIAAARQLRGAGWPAPRVAVNVSPQQFLAGHVVRSIEEALREAQMPAECLEIELTETAVQLSPLVVETLHELRRLGVAVALDDFGAGYSSLKSIDELPLTRVKLDRSLMRDVDTNASAAAIAHSIIRLCRTLGLTVTAEGIERLAQLGFLADCGDVHIQGYLIARPAPLDEIARFTADTARHLSSIWRQAAAAREEATLTQDASLLPFRRLRAR